MANGCAAGHEQSSIGWTECTMYKTMLAAQYGLVNGGTAGVIWMTVGVIVGALCIMASIAEMASMLVVLCVLSDKGECLRPDGLD